MARLAPGGGLTVVYAGVTGPVGPTAEYARALRVDSAGVLRYQTAPGVARCDGDDVLFPELYDAAAGRFRAVSIAPPDGDPLPVSRAAPPWASRPPLGLYRWTAASTQLGDGGRADALRPPLQLADGRADTAWVEGATGTGRGAFVTAHARAPGQLLAGIRIVRAPGAALRRLVLFARDGERVLRHRLELGDGPPGEALWVALPSPTPADCVSLAIADAAPARGHTDSGLAEAELFSASDADGEVGAVALARAAAAGGRGADDLAAVLARAGERGVAAVAAALPSVDNDGRRRLLRVLVASDSPAAAAPLVGALRDGTSDERALVRAALAAPALTRPASPTPAREPSRSAAAPALTTPAPATPARVPGSRPAAAPALATPAPATPASRASRPAAAPALAAPAPATPASRASRPAAAASSVARVDATRARPSTAASDADAGARAGTAAASVRAAAVEPLFALASDDGAPPLVRADAITLLASGADARSVRRLVAVGLAGGFGDAEPVRAALRRAAASQPGGDLVALVAEDVRSARHLDDDVRLLGVLAARPTADGAGADALGGTDVAGARALAAVALARAWEASGPDDFAVRFRVLRAAARVGHRSLRPIVEAAAASDDEVLRWAAVDAAAALDGRAGAGIVVDATRDPDPRVRATALAALADVDPAALLAAAPSALDDPWPLVRLAAAEHLGAERRAMDAGGGGARCGPAVAEALGRAALPRAEPDAPGARSVEARAAAIEGRRAALRALARCDGARAAPLALRFIADAHAPPLLREDAAAVAGALRPPDAAPVLAAALDDVLADPRADERASALAAALVHALAQIHDRRAEAALVHAAAPPLPSSLRAAAVRALAPLCTAATEDARAAALHDPDVAVRAAAAGAPPCPPARR